MKKKKQKCQKTQLISLIRKKRAEIYTSAVHPIFKHAAKKNTNNTTTFQNKQKTWAIWGTIIGIGFTILKCAMVMLFAMLLFLAGNKNGSIERIQKTSPACIEYQTYKNNPEFSMNRTVKYRKVKNACGEDIFFGILEDFSADD